MSQFINVAFGTKIILEDSSTVKFHVNQTSNCDFKVTADTLLSPLGVIKLTGLTIPPCDKARVITAQDTLLYAIGDLQAQISCCCAAKVTYVHQDNSQVITVDNTDPLNPIVQFQGVFVDNVTITGNGTLANPLVSIGGGGVTPHAMTSTDGSVLLTGTPATSILQDVNIAVNPAFITTTIAQPITQIVYGTGTSVTSNPNFTYDDVTGILTLLDPLTGNQALQIVPSGNANVNFQMTADDLANSLQFTQVRGEAGVGTNALLQMRADDYNTGFHAQTDFQTQNSALSDHGVVFIIDLTYKAAFTADSLRLRPTLNASAYEIRFYEIGLNGGANYVGFKAAAAVAADVMWTLPISDSTGTQSLVSDGAGNLSWASFGTGTVTSVSGTANRITSTGGTTPVIDISAAYVGQTSITTLGTITTGTWNGTAIANANLANSSVTINGSSVSLGGSVTITAVASSLVVGTTTITSGTTTRILYDNAGTLGEYTITGTGTVVVMATTPTIATPSFTTGFTIGGVAASGTIPRGNGTNFVASTFTIADTYSQYDLIYASAANTLTGFSTANTSTLVTSSTGVPSWKAGTVANRVLTTDGTAISFSQVTEAMILLADNTTDNVSSSAHGFFPKLTSNSVYYVNSLGVLTALTVGASGTVLTGNGVTSAPTWNASSSGITIGTTAITSGTATRVLFEGAGNVVQESANFTFATATLTLGVATSALGVLALCGSTSGTASLQANATAGTPTITLPDTTTTLVGYAKLGTFTAAQTFTTLLLKVADISDANGNISIANTATASSVDYFTVVNAATANPATIKFQATGSDSNINTLFSPKGTGKFQVSDGTDLTKILAFDLSGATTAITGTFLWSPTTAKTLTFPNVTSTIAVLGLAQTFTLRQTISGGGITVSATGTGTINFSNTSGVYRTTNGGSDVTPFMIVDVDASATTAGAKAYVLDTTNGFGITAANGTRRILRCAIQATNLTNTAGSEAGDLAFYTQNAGAAITEAGRFGAALDFQQIAKTSKYNNITTAGWGIPAIYGETRATGQTAANASVTTYTVGAADGSFLVSANVLVTTSSAENFTVTVSYTDEGNTARTLTLNFQTIAGVIGTAIAFANGAVPYEGIPTHLRCKASTAITIKTAAGGTYTGATYNVEGAIIQIS